MELLRDFKNINKNDVSLAGGKGASLGEMMQAGISVPSGFVILASAFEKFLEETDLNVEIDAILDSVNHKEIHTVENASEKIQALILQAEMPKDIFSEIQKYFRNLKSNFVAVRSSATAEDSASATWAGQLESYLNTTEESLLENVKKCWASLFTPRAIFYRFEKDLHKQKISVAIVVQKMVESKKSGVAFSVHPVTQDRNQLIIEAGFGLGEAIVSGQITPDSYVVEKQPRRLIDKNVQTQSRGLYRAKNGGNEWRDITKEQGEKQALSDKEILELSEIILRIKNHYNFPCDIEWAFENGKFYIVQSRPIMTLTKSGQEPKIDNFDDFLFLPEGRRASYFYPHYSIVHMYSVPNEVWPLDVCVMGNSKNHLVKWYMVIESEKEFDKYLDRFISNPSLLGKLEIFITEVRESILKKLDSDLQKLTHDKLSELTREYYSQFENILRAAGTLRCIDRAIIPHLKKLFTPSTNPDDLIRLASISDKLSFSLKEKLELLQLATQLKKERVRSSSKKAVEKIKIIHNNYCWTVCGYFDEKAKTIPDYVVTLEKMMGEQPEVVLSSLNKKIAEEAEKKKEEFAKVGHDEKLLVYIASTASYLKDYFKFSINKMTYYAEPLFAEIARRIDKTPDIIKNLYPQETIALLNGEVLNESKIRERVNHNVLISSEGKFYEYVGNEAVEFQNRYLIVKSEAKKEFMGRVASVGYGRGKAKIILSGKDFYKLEEGNILVVTNTSPDFVPIMRRASAIVAEEGGLTAHVSVVSRELGIPCIVGIQNITSLIEDGAEVEVDTKSGVVRILK